MAQGRTLVLSVDRDDDIGYKAQVESPCIGRAACLKAANTLALADPEDSDVNAIFQAIKIFDELITKGEDTQVAVISGNHMHMITVVILDFRLKPLRTGELLIQNRKSEIQNAFCLAS